MTILITGVAGFIGFNYAKFLLDKSKNNPESKDDYYGLRRECNGAKTLREFLIENGIKDFN